MKHEHIAWAICLGLWLASGMASGDELRVDPAIIQGVASEDELAIRVQPQLEIREFDNHIQEHFIQDGRTRVIKITPRQGSSYYLVDPDGDGNMGMRRDTGGSGVNPSRWVLRSW